jgi:CDP-diacylglycerol--serine O-phosphatidyltransferase
MLTIRRVPAPRHPARAPAPPATTVTASRTAGGDGTTTAAAGGGRGSRWQWRPCLNLANILTTLSLACGLAAIWAAVRHGIPVPPGGQQAAVLLIIAAAGLDAADGPVARRRRTAGPFGAELDSLADVIAGGVAPAVIIYGARLYAVPVAGAVVALAWCVAAAWRLARFPLVKEPGAFTGCPVPLAACAVASLTLATGPLLSLAVVTAGSAAMISAVPVPAWHAIRRFRPPWKDKK